MKQWWAFRTSEVALGTFHILQGSWVNSGGWTSPDSQPGDGQSGTWPGAWSGGQQTWWVSERQGSPAESPE